MHRTRVVLGHVSSSLEVKPTASSETATVTNNKTGKSADIQITDGTIKASDLKQVSLKTYDPGYTNTTCCVSTISFIDGDKGILRYRGIPIEQLAEKSSHLASSYLVIYGELPTPKQLETFSKRIMQASCLTEDLMARAQHLSKAFPHTAHPMHMLCAGFTILGSCFPEQNPAAAGGDVYKDPVVRNQQIERIMGAGATLSAMAYCHSKSIRMNMPDPNLGYAENFLNMIGMQVHPKLAKALDVLMILHEEHELNCSTSSMRHISSSNACVYTAVSGAVAALFGPLHGGANEAVLRMLEEIGDVKNVPGFVERVKSRDAQLMGFGHRVYKNFDPRAKIVRKICDDVFEICGRDPLLDVAMALEKIALEDDFFISRKLYPNVDFYSGLIYKAMGFPTDFFTCLFALPRLAGWLSHWNEFIDDKDRKIYRPFQVYKGIDVRSYEEASKASK